MTTSHFSQLLVFNKYTHTWNPLWKLQETLTFSKWWSFLPQKIFLKKSQYFIDRKYTLMPGKTSGVIALLKTELRMSLWLTALFITVHWGARLYRQSWEKSYLLLWKCATASWMPSLESQTLQEDLSQKIYCYENCQIQESQDFQSRASQEVLSRSGSNYEMLCYT